MRRILFLISATALLLPSISAGAAEPAQREPYGIGLEGFAYPYPVNMLPLVNDGEQVRMAYMDVAPMRPNGRVVVLLHGRNFPSSYWAPVIKTLNDAGYRVLVPDQIGFGKSSKPSADLHFDTLAHPRRPLCKACLDWSERRHHLAGTLGAAIMTRLTELKWAARDAAPGSRVVNFTRNGEKRFVALFGEGE